ncbi:hypothetical protein Pden_3590 [Paracoccus denitrificans PD1222]|uniref:Uncharacterized protein n=1 Tax=Paracoccus denitrificans (strain Pd 1222) TaxID=318586 RepID=A1B814_PARDP|nr:hypothetical protein Pden_3590 [Paracoccus denitrificans PD1222]
MVTIRSPAPDSTRLHDLRRLCTFAPPGSPLPRRLASCTFMQSHVISCNGVTIQFLASHRRCQRFKSVIAHHDSKGAKAGSTTP